MRFKMRRSLAHSSLFQFWFSLVALGSLVLFQAFAARTVHAAPEAHILRIDPRASTKSGNPIITTVIELQQSKRISKATAHCATLSNEARLTCIAQALEKPLYQKFPFPKDSAIFSVSVDGSDRPSKLLSVENWGKSQQQPGVGTAWLLLIDADSRMGASFADAQQVAEQFVAAMGPNDLVNVMYFNDRQIFNDSDWQPASKKQAATTFIRSVTGTLQKSGRNRPLLTIIKNGATDGFKALGNVGGGLDIPLHQAMVVLSTGFGGADPATTGPGALQLSEYMTNGRFPEDNTALPKTPVPVISIYFPTRTFDEFANNSLEFMEGMANPQIGGFFNVVQAGEGSRAKNIVGAVRRRFSEMDIVKWKVSCIAPSITQTFTLVFKDVKPPIVGDGSFKDVPIGIDPTTWPLDINIEQTRADAKDGVHPGGTFKVYGDFCWGGDKNRAEVYFVPAGQGLPAELKGANIEQAKKAQQHLISQGMRGESLQSADTFAEFQAPDNDKLIHGSGSQAVARFVIYDNGAKRMSGVTAETIVQVKARSAPFPLVLVLGVLLGVTVIALLLVVVVRSGGKRRDGGGRPPPAPVVAGPAVAAPQPIGMAAPVPPPPAHASRAVLQGRSGVFTVPPELEMRVGRDGATCAILLSDPTVSSFHATVKLQNGQLWVRDENSNNGTFIGGTRLAPAQWTPVAHGSALHFGTADFTARLE
ncbi:MAG: hypothetical protein RJA70_1956 [Pseudomonadota bacterium]|jgi:hypothetical protein